MVPNKHDIAAIPVIINNSVSIIYPSYEFEILKLIALEFG